jgi:hypothetical protein
MKNYLPGQAPEQRQESQERGQATERITVLVDVDFANAKVRTQELRFVNGRLQSVGAVSDWRDRTQLDIPEPEIPDTGLVIYYGASTNGTDAYSCTVTPTLSALANGVLILLHVDVDNNGACSLDVGFGAKSIKVTSDLSEGYQDPDNILQENDLVLLAYEAANDHFRLLNTWK